jgi:hypothetical protein
MKTTFENATEQTAAFQKMWLESTSRMIQAGLSVAPSSDPAVLDQMRAGMFQALSKSWEDFMRSPQFLESMKQWMTGLVTMRKLSGGVLARVRNELQAPSRDDIDAMLLAVRHLETRVLDRLDKMAVEIGDLKSRSNRARSKSRFSRKR